MDPRAFSLRQKYGNHTLGFIDYKFLNKREYILPEEGADVSVRWGQSPLGVRSFYGYVNHYETYINEDEEQMTRVVLLGTSRELNNVTPQSWRNVTRSSIARSIAKKHKLRSVVHVHQGMVDNWTTGVRSDFLALGDLAEEIGYDFWVDGSTLYFLNPNRLAGAGAVDAPEFLRDDIYKISVTGGGGSPRDGKTARRKVVYGLDRTTNQFFKATGPKSKYPTEVVAASVGNYGEAKRITDTKPRAVEEFFTAKVSLKGNSAIHPGSPVYLEADDIAPDQEGVWITTKADHYIDEERFTTDVIATRASARPGKKAASRIRGVREIEAISRNGIWVASRQEHVNA